MIWNDHSRDVPAGAHAFLGASKYSWINYDIDKLRSAYLNYLAVQKGTRLHAFACECINLGQKLPRSNQTLNMYVNDAIGYKMRPEQALYFSPNSFGTSDSIMYKNGVLRIHDLKTGVTPASLHQLEVYAALFFLEYGIRPEKTNIKLQIYQNDDVLVGEPTADDIYPIMEKMKLFDGEIEKLKAQEG